MSLLFNHLKQSFVHKILFFFLLFFSLTTTNSKAQEKRENTIIKSFKSFTKLPRESVFVHLNKSTFIVGESLGFKAYVFDKATDKLSEPSSNLYCLITDKEDHVVKKGLFLVKQGTTSNTFEIDSTLKTGTYKFKAYSNWMRNFEEKLSFSQEFSVIDPAVSNNTTSKNEVIDLDIQILPEGGHSIADVKNTFGVIVKNQFGKGIPVKDVAIVNKSNDTLTKFDLNRFGIAKTTFTPKVNNDYKLVFSHGYKAYTQTIDFIKDQGINLNVQTVNDKLFVSLNTNQNTLPSIANKIYKLTVHNSHNIISVDFSFKSKTNVIKLFKKANLFPGINIITVFDENNTPLLERLYFNHQKINTKDPVVSIFNTKKDSLEVSLRVLDINDSNTASISVSVLPSGTKSYNHSDNIISYIKLRPYLKGYVEEASYYFETIDNTRKQELDNLLITQGWSSYEWHSIFNKEPQSLFIFEKGVSTIVNFNKKKNDQFMIHPMSRSKSIFFSAKDSEKTAKIGPLFPMGEEEINISELDKKGNTIKPLVYLTFEPNNILNVNLLGNDEKSLKNRTTLFDISDQNVFIKDQQNLDEVVINTSVKRTKYDLLKQKSRGNIDIFDDNKREAYTDFATYISSKGFFVNQNINRSAGQPLLDIRNTRRTTIGALQRPLIFLDNVLLSDFSILANFKMDTVDYIEVDKSGSGLGMRGANGVIRIFTDPSVKIKDSYGSLAMKSSKFPVSFEEEKKYYSPKYNSYSSAFYENYGVIDWLPNLKPDNTGAFRFKLINTNLESINIYVEGMTSNGVYISKFKKIRI